MVNINTNLSSFLVRQQLSNSTNMLNQAIERMTTGYKINHASDNAANYAIIQNMDRNISAYDVAADNVAMGSDCSAVAQDTLDLVGTHLQRIRDLLSQAANGTYGADSRKAIQAEVDARLSEINRIFKSAEYNGIQLFNNGILPSTLNINISELNLNAGSFNVNVDGNFYTINLTNDDSLYSIISKLNAIGVEADFNEDSGVFTVEIEADKITDNGTGFVSVLGLGSTDGYVAEDLKTYEVYTVLETAKADTQLSAVGITDGSFTITDIDGNETNDIISVDATISDLFSRLWTHQISGSINSSGVLTLTSTVGNRIGGALAEQMGINIDTVDTVYEGLSLDTTNTLTHTYLSNANANTTLDKLGVQAGETLVVKDNSGADLYTYTATDSSIQNTTLGELFSNIVDAGYLSNVSVNNGVVSINSDVNNYVTGTIAQRFGIRVLENDNPSTTGISQTSSDAITYNYASRADGNTTLAELGIQAGETFIINDNLGNELFNYTADNISIQNNTIGDFLNDLVGSGYLTSANITNGVISLSSDVNNYATGTIANRLGIDLNSTIVSETTVVSVTSAEAVTYGISSPLSENSKLADIGVQDGEELIVYHQSGVVYARYIADELSLNTTTLGDVISGLSSYINISVDDGVVSVSSDDYLYLGGEIANRIGISAVKENVNVTTGIPQTSSTSVIYTKSGALEGGASLGSYGIEDGESLYLRDNSGVILYTYTATENSLQSDSLEQILDFINRMGYIDNYSISNGIVSISSNASNYITGEIADRLGMGVNTTNRLETVAIALTSSAPVANLSYYTTLEDLGLSSASFTMNDNSVINISSSDYILSSFAGAGLDAYIDDNKITINGGVNNYIKNMSSELASVLKIQVGEGYSYEEVNNTYHSNTNSNQMTGIATYKMSQTTTLGDLGLSNESFTMANGTVINLSSSDCIYDKLTQAGLNVDIYDGAISIDSNGGILKSMSSNLANKLYIETGEGNSYDVSTHLYYVNHDSESQTIVNTYSLSTTTTLGELGLSSASFTLNNNSVISLSSADSIYSKLQNAGLNVVLTDGILSIEGDENIYLKQMSSNLANKLNLSIGEGNSYIIDTYTINSNTTSNTQNISTTNTITSTTTLGQLGLVSASFTMNDNTVISLNSNDSVYSKLQNAGLDVRISMDGKLTVTGDNDCYIKSMTSNLENVLKIKTGEGKTYETSHNIIHSNSNSGTQTYMSTATLSSTNASTYRMSDWGLKTNSKIYTNNVAISINRNDTIANVISKLHDAGINASVNNENGTLKIVNSDSNYITSVDTALKNVLGIEVGEGKTYNSYTVTHHSDNTSRILKESIKHTITNNATESTLLKDFNRDNLNIQGDLIFDMEDGQKVVSIDSKDTISSLIEKLKDIGIKAIFKDQSLSISGNKNSVLLLDGSSSTTSFLSELLGLQHVDKLDDFTASNNLNTLADSIYEQKFNTPQFLCIQAGITGNERDMISIDMSLKLGRVTFKTSDPVSVAKGLDRIDEIISKVTAKQTEYGAFSNRMESAAESITISLQNLISSKSTLQDADVAVESSKYIRAQILQQAAATLLATANQIPAIAIQLI